MEIRGWQLIAVIITIILAFAFYPYAQYYKDVRFGPETVGPQAPSCWERSEPTPPIHPPLLEGEWDTSTESGKNECGAAADVARSECIGCCGGGIKFDQAVSDCNRDCDTEFNKFKRDICKIESKISPEEEEEAVNTAAGGVVTAMDKITKALDRLFE